MLRMGKYDAGCDTTSSSSVPRRGHRRSRKSPPLSPGACQAAPTGTRPGGRTAGAPPEAVAWLDAGWAVECLDQRAAESPSCAPLDAGPPWEPGGVRRARQRLVRPLLLHSAQGLGVMALVQAVIARHGACCRRRHRRDLALRQGLALGVLPRRPAVGVAAPFSRNHAESPAARPRPGSHSRLDHGRAVIGGLGLVLAGCSVVRRWLGRGWRPGSDALHHVPVEGVNGPVYGGDEAAAADSSLGA
jgi:hypothetical protein